MEGAAKKTKGEKEGAGPSDGAEGPTSCGLVSAYHFGCFFTDFFLGHRSKVSVFLRARNHQAKSPKGPSSHGTIAMLRSHGFDQ